MQIVITRLLRSLILGNTQQGLARRNGNYRHGHFTAEAKEQRRRLHSLIQDARIIRETNRNEQMGGYTVAGPPSIFPFQPNDGRTVRFPEIFGLRVNFVRHVRVAAHVSRL
jgi:hypothetical protein